MKPFENQSVINRRCLISLSCFGNLQKRTRPGERNRTKPRDRGVRVIEECWEGCDTYWLHQAGARRYELILGLDMRRDYGIGHRVVLRQPPDEQLTVLFLEFTDPFVEF